MAKGYSKESLKYWEDWEVQQRENGFKIVLPVEANKLITRSHTKRYHNCLFLLAGLSGSSRDLMDFITEEMDEDNIIATGTHFINKFISQIKNYTKGEVDYSPFTVKKSLHTLFQKGLIRKMMRGIWKVNPEYFWRNNEGNRMDTIRVELEFKSGATDKLEVWRKRKQDGEKIKIVDKPTEIYSSGVVG